MAAVLLFASAAATARAQDDEASDESSEGYAWGEDGGEGAAEEEAPEDPLRIMGFVGAGAGFRLIRNLDFKQGWMSPAYAKIGAAVFLPGREFRHGFGLNMSANLTSDARTPMSGLGPWEQWSITPSYRILLPGRRLFGWQHDWLSFQGRIGIPLVFSRHRGSGGGMDFTFGGEVGVAAYFKFLAGLGFYVEAQLDVYGGAGTASSSFTIHPIIAADAGLYIDYEVLP